MDGTNSSQSSKSMSMSPEGSTNSQVEREPTPAIGESGRTPEQTTSTETERNETTPIEKVTPILPTSPNVATDNSCPATPLVTSGNTSGVLLKTPSPPSNDPSTPDAPGATSSPEFEESDNASPTGPASTAPRNQEPRHVKDTTQHQAPPARGKVSEKAKGKRPAEGERDENDGGVDGDEDGSPRKRSKDNNNDQRDTGTPASVRSEPPCTATKESLDAEDIIMGEKESGLGSGDRVSRSPSVEKIEGKDPILRQAATSDSSGGSYGKAKYVPLNEAHDSLPPAEQRMSLEVQNDEKVRRDHGREESELEVVGAMAAQVKKEAVQDKK